MVGFKNRETARQRDREIQS
jgi:hypothetical protein